MESLKTLIRNLAFILLLATFLEMLLPNEKMRGFVQTVMGLFVLAAILTPLVGFLKIDFNNEIPAFFSFTSSEMTALASGHLADEHSETLGQSAIIEQYRRVLINQIKMLVLAIDGVKAAEVEVALDDSEKITGYPAVKKIEITFTRQDIKVTPVKPVIIGEEEQITGGEETRESALIREQIASFMQISPEIISVHEQ